jgi:hypothetical protein
VVFWFDKNQSFSILKTFSEHQLLPDLDIFNLSASATGASSGTPTTTKKKEELEEELDDSLPLFYQ